MRTIYIVNELNEADCNYNECHGVFPTKELADKKALEIFETAKNCISQCEFNDELRVWNSTEMISINIDTCQIEEESTVFYSLNEEDLDVTLESQFSPCQLELMYKNFSKQDMIEILRTKLEIDFVEEIEAVIRYRVLDKAIEKETESESIYI